MSSGVHTYTQSGSAHGKVFPDTLQRIIKTREDNSLPYPVTAPAPFYLFKEDSDLGRCLLHGLKDRDHFCELVFFPFKVFYGPVLKKGVDRYVIQVAFTVFFADTFRIFKSGKRFLKFLLRIKGLGAYGKCLFYPFQTPDQCLLYRIQAGSESKLKEVQEEVHHLPRLRIVFPHLFFQTCAVILEEIVERLLIWCEGNRTHRTDLTPCKVALKLPVLTIDLKQFPCMPHHDS